MSKSLIAILSLAIAIHCLPANATPSSHPQDLGSIELGGLAAGETRCASIRTPGEGLLLLDAALTVEPGVEPWLEVEPSPSPRARTRAVTPMTGSPMTVSPMTVVDATSAHRLVYTPRSLDLTACVGVQDPRRAAQGAVLRTAFVPWDKNQEMEIEPEGQKNQEMEIEPEGFTVRVFDALCAQLSMDDHGDGMEDHGDVDLCASPLPLGRRVQGRHIGSVERDVFTFELDTLTAVALDLQADPGTRAELVDAVGQRLLVLDPRDPMTGRQFRTLPAGSYFLRVGGGAGSGDYALRVDEMRRPLP